MCKFENDFLLCACSDDLKDSEIDWILKKRSKAKPYKSSKIIGQITIPEAYKHMTPEAYHKMANARVDQMLKDYEEMLSKLNDVSPSELKNILINIQFDLNNRNCFDTEMVFTENDVLSIRINTKELIWADFVFRNSFWEILEVDHYEYKHITKGTLKVIS